MVHEPPFQKGFTRTGYLVAVRLYFGLRVTPAIPDSGDMLVRCGNTGSLGHANAGVQCPDELDDHGVHALLCALGGATMMRHNALRDGLGQALRGLVSGVWWERWIPELSRTDGKQARLDLVVQDPIVAAMLDVTVFWPIRPDGRTVAVTQNAERRKHTTYQTRDGNGARLTNLPLVPVAVNVFGSVGEEAATYFDSVELVAKQRKRPYRPAPGGPRTLTELTALLTILTAADIVVATHSRRRAPGDQGLPALLTCDTCGKLRTDLPITCKKCLEGRSYRRRHLNGRACGEARCTEDCPGRSQAAAPA